MRDARPAAIGFLLVQLVIGYEWLSSGLTKLRHGDFPGGLANDLHERAKEASSWYVHFLDPIVIPHAPTWGYAIEIAEVAIGVTLIVSAVAWLLHPTRRVTAWLAGLTAAAALGGLLLSLNLTLAKGYGVGPIGPDSFDEGITLDVLLIGIQAIICGVGLRTLADSRRPTLEAVPRSARERAA